MRKIQFRAWNKEWGMTFPVDRVDWHDGEVVNVGVTVDATDYPHKNEWIDHEVGVDVFLMQNTCLLDRNGKEIYEGDILQGYTFLGAKHGTYEMKWRRRSFDLVRIGTEDSICYLAPSLIEIIGNVYENPELVGNPTSAPQPKH